MKSRDEGRRGGRDWRDEQTRDGRGRDQGQGQHEAFQGHSMQMGGSEYGGREAGGGRGERSAFSDEERRRQANDYERGYWANDFDRGDVEPDRGSVFHGRDSWRTHGQGARFGGSGRAVGGEQGRGTLGAGYMSGYGDDENDWDMPSGPRTWGSGFGSGMQGRARGQGRHSDPDYLQWRNEQLERFDDDFEAFRRERYGKFAEEFNTWRSNRSNQKSSSESSAGATASTGSQGGGSASGASAASGSGRATEPSATPKQHG